MTRRKAPALDLPETLEEAAALVARVAALEADIAGIEAERKVRLALLNEEIAQRIAVRRDEVNALVPRISAWWQAAGRDALARNAKSVEFAGCKIGMRTDPQSLGWAKGNSEKSMTGMLAQLRWAFTRKLLRVSYALDKDAIVRALGKRDSIADRLVRLGFVIKQEEKFFIEPVAAPEDDA